MPEVIVNTKEKTFRGNSLAQLQNLDTREVAKYFSARSRRSVLRHFDVIERFVQDCEKKIMKKKKIRTHLRDLVVVPRLVGMIVAVHNGRSFQPVEISVEMIGHRLGEFAQTRARVAHSAAGIGATKGSKAKKK